MPDFLCQDRLLKAVFFLVAATAIACGRKAEKTGTVLLKDAARLFQNASRPSGDAIPDGVLNRAKCVVVIPAISGATAFRPGTVSCRDTSGHWASPVFITFKELTPAKPADLLIFILQDASVRALRAGALRIRPQGDVTAPLVSTTPMPNQLQLSSELLVYQYVANVLSAGRAGGVIAPQPDNASYHDDGKVSDKVTKQYLSSMESFFNTIRPTGIVLHHTALIPNENALPRNRREVDKYHEARGFEIRCSGHVYHEAYHFLILPDGHVQRGRPETCQGAHAMGYNSYLGISIVGDFSSEDNPSGEKGPIKPSEKQIDSLIKLCRRLKESYNIPLNHIVRHSDTSSTKCPGDRFPFSSVLQQVQAPEAKGSRPESR
jgi:N-acetylmuramoyl-L-alanine amidase